MLKLGYCFVFSCSYSVVRKRSLKCSVLSTHGNHPSTIRPSFGIEDSGSRVDNGDVIVPVSSEFTVVSLTQKIS